MVNPPKENPKSKKDHKLTSPKYSGEKNRKGTPKFAPIDSEMIANNKPQYMSPKKLYFKWPFRSTRGKKSRISFRFSIIPL